MDTTAVKKTVTDYANFAVKPANVVSPWVRKLAKRYLAEVADHQFRYYVLDAPVISDGQLDALWRELGYGDDILPSPWPQVDESALVQDELDLVLQINGKLRGSITVAANADKATIEAIAVASEVVQKQLAGTLPKKVVVVPGRLVNIVC